MRNFAIPLVASLVCSLAISAGCLRSETTQKDNEGSGVSTPEDVDDQPVTVLPDSRVVTAGEDTSTGGADSGARDVGTSDGEVGETGDDRYGEVWRPESGDFVLRDEETGSMWNIRGEAYAGPLKGAKLERVPGFSSFWFAWSIFYHGSEIWQSGGDNVRNDPGPIPEGEDCEVPCSRINQNLAKDAIPALDYDARKFAGNERPRPAEMVEPGGAGTDYLSDDTFVFGVVVDGEPRAYPHNIYWRHEIHNDRVGETEFTVSFCPLTGSGIAFPGMFDGRPIRFGVSGRLFQANLVMFDPESDTFWSQMLLEGVKGPHRGRDLDIMPVVETTWERWKEMYPGTLVTSSNTGYGSGYNTYPYGNYREPNSDPWRGTRAHDEMYPPKVRTLGLPGDTNEDSVAYPYPELDELPGDRNVVHDEVRGERIAVVYEAEHRLAIPYRAAADGRELTFVGTTAE